MFINIFKHKNYYEFKYFCIIIILLIISYNFKKYNLQNNKTMKIKIGEKLYVKFIFTYVLKFCYINNC